MNRMNKKYWLGIAALATILNVGCFHRMAPGGHRAAYKETSDVTVYEESPYGIVEIPGKWEPGKYNKTSRQQYFYRADTTTLIAAISNCKSLPFAKKAGAGYDWVKGFYELEERMAKMQGNEMTLLEDNTANRYRLWTSRVDGIDQYFLFGLKDCDCGEPVYRSLVLKTRKMTADEKRKLLVGIFMES